MKATLALAVGLLLCTLACGVAEPKSQLSGPRHARVKRQESGTCTAKQFVTFEFTYDQSCDNATELLFPLVGELLESIAAGKEIEQVTADEAKQLLDLVCSDICLGAVSKLISECTPYIDGFPTAEDISNICGYNGDFYCLLASLEVTDTPTFLSALQCIDKWVESDYTCTPACNDVQDRIRSQFGCCANAFVSLALEDQNITSEEYFKVCGIEDPGVCKPRFVEVFDEDKPVSGTCTLEPVVEFFATVNDSVCENDTDRLDPLLEAVSESLFSGQPVDEDAADELAELLPTICSDCFGPTDKLLSVCTPDFGDNFSTPEEIVDQRRLCATNEDYFCLLAQDRVSSLFTLQSAALCVFAWLSQPDQDYVCPSTCTLALDTLIDEVGCCTSTIMSIILDDQSRDIAEYYTLCRIRGPEECLPSYAESQEDSGVTMAATTGLILALVSAVLSVI